MQDFPSNRTHEFSENIEIQSFNSIQQGLNITGFLQTIKRNILLIAGITSVSTLVFYRTHSVEYTYTGDFQLLVEPASPEANYSQTNSFGEGVELDYSTIITILKSPRMLASIIEQIQVEYPDFTQARLKDNLEISRLILDESDLSNQTKIIEVSYAESDPDLVNLVLEKMADKYLRYSLEERTTQIDQGVSFIEEQLSDSSTRVENLQIKLQQLREKYKLIDPKVKGEELLKQVNQIDSQKREANTELLKLRTLKQNLERQLGMTAGEARRASALSESTSYKQLLEQSKLLDSEISIETAKFTINSPQLNLLYDKQQNLSRLLNQESQKILGGSFQSKAASSSLLNFQNSISSSMAQQLVETTNQISLLEIQLSSLTTIQSQFNKKIQQIPNVSRQYEKITKELAIANKTYDQLLAQRDSLRIEQAQSQVPWEIVSSPQLLRDSSGAPATLPTNSSKVLAMTLLGSLIVGIIGSMILEKSRNIFYSVEDLEQGLLPPILGSIPLDGDRSVNNPKFLAAFDDLYANIKFRFDELTLNSVVVSSVDLTDERVSIALHLAETIAAIGHKVLLVDADLRSQNLLTNGDMQYQNLLTEMNSRSQNLLTDGDMHYRDPIADADMQYQNLSAQMGLSNKIGLCELLIEENNLDFHDVIQKSHQDDNLFVLSSGKILANSTRMLASDRMKYLNRELEETFDLIIYNTPDFSSSMDTSFLATHTDGILTVVEVGKTSKSSVNKALEQIEKFKLKNLGVIAVSDVSSK